jgi:hypothetical protein
VNVTMEKEEEKSRWNRMVKEERLEINTVYRGQ